MSINRLINADSSRNLLSKVLQTQLGNCGILCSCEQLVWFTSGFKASGANVVISSASNKRLRLIKWMANMAWPCAWLLWPDQEKNEQRSELNRFGFSFAQGLAQMSMGSDLVPQRISCYEGRIPCEIRVANCSDLRGLVMHYKILHSIPENYACQVAKAHLGADRQNVCCTWVAVHRPKILSAITAYRFGSLGLISWLATCPSARRQGIGSSLLLHALNYLRDGGVDRIELHAVSEATRLYQEVGFTKEYDVELWIHPGLT